MPTVSADAEITISHFRWTVVNAMLNLPAAVYSSPAIIFICQLFRSSRHLTLTWFLYLELIPGLF